MTQLEIEADAAVLLQDAVKGLLDLIGRFRLEHSTTGDVDLRRLTTTYAELRRVRESVARRLVPGATLVDIDLAPRESDLAAYALVFRIAELEMAEPDAPQAARADLARTVELGSSLAVELATNNLIGLIPELRADHLRRSPTAMKVISAVRRRLDPAIESGVIVRDPFQRRTEDEVATNEVLEFPEVHVEHARLRSLVAIDLAALRRSISAADFRSATLHLAAVLEGVVIDIGITRAERLALSGKPETWGLLDVIERALNRSLEDEERSTVAYLEAFPRLMRPSLQLNRPLVANRKSFIRCRDFVEELCREFGLITEAVRRTT
jgi:hypothetical protein